MQIVVIIIINKQIIIIILMYIVTWVVYELLSKKTKTWTRLEFNQIKLKSSFGLCPHK